MCECVCVSVCECVCEFECVSVCECMFVCESCVREGKLVKKRENGY